MGQSLRSLTSSSNGFSLGRVRLCAIPQMGAHQAPPSLGLSRQEHWSGLPFPSPMHESEKWKWSRSVLSDSLRTPWTAAYQAPPCMGFSRQEYWSGVPLPSTVEVQTALDKWQKNGSVYKLFSVYLKKNLIQPIKRKLINSLKVHFYLVNDLLKNTEMKIENDRNIKWKIVQVMRFTQLFLILGWSF